MSTLSIARGEKPKVFKLPKRPSTLKLQREAAEKAAKEAAKKESKKESE